MASKILLVDDEPNLTSALKHALYKEKHKIFTAVSANEALGILSRENIDVIVSDEQMPGMSGSELVTIVRRKYPDTIRIILTGQASSKTAFRAINEGEVYRFLIKPCNGLDLVITIRRALQYKLLLNHCQQMLKHIHQQSSLLRLLEDKNPGITKIKASGAMLMDKPDYNFGALIKMIETELKKSEAILRDGDNSPSSETSEEKSTPGQSKTQPQAAPTEKVPPIEQEVEKPSENIAQTQTQTQTQTAAPKATPAAPADSPDQESTDSVSLEGITDIKDLKPIMTRSGIRELLDGSGELKGMSPAVAQILKMTRQSNCSLEKVVKVVKQDHGISIKILKLANSSAYTRGEPVDTVQKAVMRIGMTQIRQVVLNISVIDNFSDDRNVEHFSIPMFWEHSIATGLIAAEITRSLKGKDPEIDAAFTMGLLHDIGKVVYMEILGEKYLDIIKIAHKMQVPLERVESRMLLINHADAMDRILHTWKFPKELINPIALHQLSLGNIRRMAPRSLNEVTTLALANRLAHALLLGTSGNLTLYPTEEFVDVLGLKGDQIKDIEEEIPGQTDDIKITMLAQSKQRIWPRLCDELSDQLNQPLNAIYLSAEPDFDSLRVFCDRMQNTTEQEAPNIGIIQIRNPRERVMLTTKFKDAEAEADVEPLPLIIFSPKGNIQLEENFMANRSAELLPFPITISRIIGKFNKLVLPSPATASV